MSFTTALVAEQVGDVDWRLRESLVYEGNRDRFEIGSGFETDFASVPPAFQWLIPRSGRYTTAAVLHDFLWRRSVVGKADADGIFRRAMRELGVPFLRRWIMWAAVRWTSLVKSRFRDGAKDLPRLLLVSMFPGALAVACGVVVLVFLLGFWLLEYLSLPALALTRITSERARKKELVRPKLFLRA